MNAAVFTDTSNSPSVSLPAAVPSHGEPAMLSGAQDVPVCTLRPRVHRVRPDDSAMSPPLPAGQERLLQTDGYVWCQLATGDGLQQVGTAAIIWVHVRGNEGAASVT